MVLAAAQMEQLIPLVPLLPLLGAIVNGLLGPRLPRAWVGFVACAAVFASFVLCTANWLTLVRAEVGADPLSVVVYRWINVGDLGVDVRFVVDRLAAVMGMVITGVGFLIHLYSVGYMEHEPALSRYFCYLNLFTFAMLVLVLADSLPLMFVGWEGVGLCSYLLIGFWYSDEEKAAAGKKAFIVNRIGDFGVIMAMLVLFHSVGTLNFAGLREAATGGMVSAVVASTACLLLILGATGKSAQIPLYVWLPDAMAGPTPVSALIHAATMVTAGVYMVARLGFLFDLAPTALGVLACLGIATALLAASIAAVQNDIKKVLAYSTVSQLGFMFVAAGVGAYAVAIFHVVTHAFFKACLFLAAGSVIHGLHGEQDIRRMGGLWRKMPLTCTAFVASTLAITGFPLMSGFVSKDAILWSVFSAGSQGHSATSAALVRTLWALGLVAAAMTAFYMWRLVLLTFFSGSKAASLDPQSAVDAHESPRIMTVPLLVLGFLAVVGGALSWPHLLGGHAWLEGWLNASLARGFTTTGSAAPLILEILSMVASTVMAVLGFLLAFIVYRAGAQSWSARMVTSQPWRWVYQQLLGKWHVDELYDATLVRPLGWCARVICYNGLDRRGIDGVVGGVGWFVRSVGFLGQVFQSGNIQRYLAVFMVGLAVFLYAWMGGSSAALSTAPNSSVTQTPQAAGEAP